MHKFSEYTQMIETAINAMQLPAGKLAGLYEPITYGLQAGGKRLRPVLTLMTAEAFGIDAPAAIDAALAVETFHNFTLLHDDVMDNSPTRRGRTSVQAKYGINSAILSGDTMLTLATQMAMHAPDSKLRQLLDCFNTTAIEVYEGQQLDIDFESRTDVSLDEYLEMIRLKTSVLLGCAAKMGAIIAGAPAEDCNGIYAYAMYLGLAFQIKDDLLDVYGTQEFGKPIGGDILNNKKTYLLITALNSPLRSELLEALKIDEPAAKIRAVRDIYDRAGVRRATEKAIADYSDKANRTLESLIITPQARQAFRDLCNSLVNRNK